MASIKDILVDCVQAGLGLPRDPIPTDIRDLALRVINQKGRAIFDSWPWDNSKVPEFTAPTAVAGIITFASTVDVIRAIRPVTNDQDGAAPIWAQDEMLAAARGESVSSERFIPMPDDTAGCRRVKLGSVSETNTVYKALALLRWVDATVESTYDSTNPSATPTDYRYMTFLIDRAEPALREFAITALKKWKAGKSDDDGAELLRIAKKREDEQGDREHRINPRNPAFSELGNW